MAKQSNGAMLLGLFLIAAIVAGGSWFFYFSPTLDGIAETREALENQQDVNEKLENDVRVLALEYANIDDMRAELAEFTAHLPPVEDSTGLTRLIDRLVREQGLVIQSLALGAPSTIDNTITLADAAAATNKASYVESLSFVDLAAMSFFVDVVGPRERVYALVNELQFGEHRYLLVDTVNVLDLEPALAAPPLPAIGPDFVRVTINGYFFTLIQPGIDPNFKPGQDGDIPTVSEPEPSVEPSPAPTAGPSPSPSPAPAG